MRITKRKNRTVIASAIAAALTQSLARAGTSTNTSGPVQQGTNNSGVNNPAVTISFSGQTALRSFDTSQGITELTPGTDIILHDGTNGAPVEYISPAGDSFVQLASSDFTSPDLNPGTPGSPSTNAFQSASAIRLEWHEQGSVDGFYDLVNDEIGYAGGSPTNVGNPISNEALRTPSASNPTWINTNKFTAAGTINAFTLDNSASDLLAETYNSAVYNQATGVNIQGGQNRIQFSVGEFPTEGVSQTGTASALLPADPGNAGAYLITSGYGQGNPALASAATYTGLGVGNVRQQFQPSTILNEATTTVNPQTDLNYTSGPWNTAGVNNVTSTPIAATAVTYSANPGTGLERIDLGDAQWLQLTGRLQNGALFNVVARTVDTGQRIVFASNTGVDPSWAVGSNDDGNSTSSTAATAQHSIGTSLRFDGKTSGSEAEKTIAQSRMAVGALSVPEASAAASNAPVRALDVDFTNQTDVNPADDSTNFVRANFNSIVSNGSGDDTQDSYSRYQAVLISHYNTVKAPNAAAEEQYLNNEGLTWEGQAGYTAATTAQINAAWAAIPSFIPSQNTELDISNPATPIAGIKGDPTGDVAAFISNIADSVGTAAANLTAGNINNPGDNLYINGFLTPGLLDWTRVNDGGAIVNTPVASQETSTQSTVNSNYGKLFGTDGTTAANSENIGTSSFYGAGGASATINGNIPITSYNGNTAVPNPTGTTDNLPSGGNYLFGNFNQNGVRDYSAVVITAEAALAVLENSGDGTSMFTGTNNNTQLPDSVTVGANTYTLPTPLQNMIGSDGTVGATKGDLIVLGDYNGDGSFNGEDLYLLAIGASLADSTTSTTLTATAATFPDAVRNPNDVLRKNAALDYLNSTATSQMKSEARSVLSGATVPIDATDLHTTDPITGLEQFTYDPSGVNSFNKSDVNRDGTVDFNDATIVDDFNSNTYSSLSDSLNATIQTPVTGTTEPISLVAIQQVDGEAQIGQADVNVVNTALTGTGNANWYGYTLAKTGPGTITWGRTGGTVNVYSGAAYAVNNGTVNVGGTLDPFTDNSGTANNGNHVSLSINNGATVNLTQNDGVVTVSGLTIDTAHNSTLNLGNSAMVVTYTGVSPQNQIRQDIIDGYDNGAWDGHGITSSVAQADAANPGDQYHGNAAVGYADNNDLGNPSLPTNSVLVRFTYYGDADLNGVVNLDDFSDWLAGFQDPTDNPDNWVDGDFLYEGNVNLDDFSVWLSSFQANGGNLGSLEHDIRVSTLSSTQQQDLFNTIQAVPEPASLSILSLGAVGLVKLRPRRRKVRRRGR